MAFQSISRACSCKHLLFANSHLTKHTTQWFLGYCYSKRARP